jgi:hypothetical protein
MTQPESNLATLARELRASIEAEMRRTPELNKALFALQGELPMFGVDDQRTVEVETKGDKPNYSYRYVTLATIIDKVGPLLAKHGLSFTAFPTYADPGDGKVGLVLSYTLAHTSGEERSGLFPLKHEGSIQSLGSAITYARRYCFAAVLGIAAEQDDDGMAAMLNDEQDTGVRAQARGTTRRAPARSNRAPARPTPSAAEALPGGNPVTGEGDVPPRPMLNHMFGVLGEQSTLDGNQPSREERLRGISDIVGREITSSNDMTRDEVQKVIDVTAADIATRTEPQPEEGAQQ